MGNPLGLGHTVTAGIVSGKGRILHHDRMFGSDDFIQTDAAINQGNSGGPLFDINGNVIGMNTAIIQGANTIGFAVPMDQIKLILTDLENKGFVSRGYLGVQPQGMSPEIARAIGADISKGALIARVFPDTAAEKYGLQPGDIVTKIDKTTIEDPEKLIQIVATKRPGTKIAITVVRKGKKKVLDLVLGERPDAAPPQREANTERSGPASLTTMGMELSLPLTERSGGNRDPPWGHRRGHRKHESGTRPSSTRRYHLVGQPASRSIHRRCHLRDSAKLW